MIVHLAAKLDLAVFQLNSPVELWQMNRSSITERAGRALMVAGQEAMYRAAGVDAFRAAIVYISPKQGRMWRFH